jgi:acyl-CoA synthetase (NDP forming)
MPRSIAVVGASDDTTKTGGRALEFLRKFGFRGNVYPINPKRDSIQGVPAYPSPAHLPEAPDLAIIAVPGDAAVEAVQGCAGRGVAAAIVTSSGFSELGEQGRVLEENLLSHANASGLRIVGPNSQGVANFSNGVVASFSSLFLTSPPADGPVAIISQSGSMSVVPYCQLRELGIGVRYSIATGNEADVNVGDFAEAVLQDDKVELVLLYLESIADASSLARAAVLAKERSVPVVVLKSGRSPQGQMAAHSHTGALANEDRLVSAFFEQCGFWRARDADELVRASELYLRRARPRGRRLAVLTDSGATAVMMADAAHELELELNPFPEPTVKRLAKTLPAYASTRNPVDMTSVLRPQPELFAEVLRDVGRDDIADLFLVGFPASGTGYDVAGLARMAAAFCENSSAALAVAVPQPTIAQHFRDAGLATFLSETEALRALAQITKHLELMAEPIATVVDVFPATLPTPTGVLCHEAESLEFLRESALPGVRSELCRSLDEARRAYRTLGPSVVMKGCARELPHKSEYGLVSLNVVDEQGLGDEFLRLSAVLETLEVEFQGVTVAEQVSGRQEFFVGAKLDPVFGPVILLGEGGKYVETQQNVVALLAPISPGQANSALKRLPNWPLWQGVRGESGVDLDAFCTLASQVSSLIVELKEEIVSLDLNPVAVGSEGEGVLILDALLELHA